LPEEKFNQPRITLSRIYTRRGDGGETALAGGLRLPKESLRIEAYGTVDELMAVTGTARTTCDASPALAPLAAILLRVQHELFNLGSILAHEPGKIHPKQPRVTEADIAQLEHEIDTMLDGLPALRSFTLAGGCRINAELHVARTVCRRAERVLVRLSREEEVLAECLHYLNRLSDALFAWSRWATHALGAEETLWQPNQASSALPNR